MNSKVFNIIRFIGEVVLPALGTLYFTVAQIWGLPYGEAVVGTIAAITVCVGAIVNVDRRNYNKLKRDGML